MSRIVQSQAAGSIIALRPWSSDDFHIIQNTVGDPAMMHHLGGVETPEQMAQRHERYLGEPSSARGGMFAILYGAGSTPVGSIGYWDSIWENERIYETGWFVLPTYAGRGIACGAASLIVRLAKRQARYRFLHAFPSVGNLASNAVCRKSGFEKLGECRIEYPPGSPMQSNNWRIDLFG